AGNDGGDHDLFVGKQLFHLAMTFLMGTAGGSKQMISFLLLRWVPYRGNQGKLIWFSPSCICNKQCRFRVLI
ncbi:MAG TPA: hypothetical protein VJ575_00170, partial [Pseudogulbenkiania sp.]|nr:hypothetical protein [Pseudogulbenkiania sp.]